jgi:hypothetical protein
MILKIARDMLSLYITRKLFGSPVKAPYNK